MVGSATGVFESAGVVVGSGRGVVGTADGEVGCRWGGGEVGQMQMVGCAAVYADVVA